MASRFLLIILFLAVFAGVIARYAFHSGSPIIQDIQHYSFALLIMLAVLIAFGKNAHIRMGMATRSRPAIEILSLAMGCFMPFLLVLLVAIKPVLFSWSVLEGSTEPDGLPGFFLVKSGLLVLAVAMMFVAAKQILHLWKIRGR